MPGPVALRKNVTSIVALKTAAQGGGQTIQAREMVAMREELVHADTLKTPEQIEAAIHVVLRHVAETTQAARSLPVLGGTYYPGVAFTAGVVQTIAHGVGGTASFLVCRMRVTGAGNTPVVVEVGQDANGRISLASAVSCVCDLWFYPQPGPSAVLPGLPPGLLPPFPVPTVPSSPPGVYPPSVAPPLVASLTWVQQAGLVAGNASGVDISPNGFNLIAPTPGDNALCIHALVMAAPAAPYTFTMGMLVDNVEFVGNFRMGLVARESSTGKMLVHNLSDQSTGTAVSSWTNATTQASIDYLLGVAGTQQTTQAYNANNPFCGPLWLRIHNDGTNLTWSRSSSGTIFMPAAISSADGFSPVPVAKNNFFTSGPNQLGVGIGQVTQATPGPGMYVFSWAFT